MFLEEKVRILYNNLFEKQDKNLRLCLRSFFKEIFDSRTKNIFFGPKDSGTGQIDMPSSNHASPIKFDKA